MDAKFAIDSLKADMETIGDPTIRDLAQPVISMLGIVEGFKRSGMYREAKYYAQYLRQRTEALSHAHTELRSVASVTQFLKDIFELPDISPEPRQDRPRPEPEHPGTEPYQPRFPPGVQVRVVDEPTLSRFKAEWHWNYPLQEQQLRFAGLRTKVAKVGYYHGGDALYTLDDTGDYVWHEACLQPI
jgi:hypothetical protein